MNTITLVEEFIKYVSKLESLIILISRLWIANIFWKSGYLKISNFNSTLFLFANEHPVPFLPPILAATSAITFELGCSLFLALGLATRFATIPLLIMIAVIQFTYLMHDDHFYWAILLGFILARGAGVFSADYLIERKLRNKKGQ